ncbi:MAG: ferrochelatase [Taibaiella sp.]|nr:ferrochelatase [Taibaiella sp.]
MPDAVKRAILLMNLGSPDSLDVKAVRTYLREFLMDERVIDSPYLVRSLLVKGLITPFRAPKTAEAYSKVWTEEGSPLITITKQLQKALQQVVDEPVAISMRYGSHPPKEAYNQLQQEYPELEEVIFIPLYPHYAMSSYETAVVYAEKQHKKGNYKFNLTILKPFYNNEQYLDALADSMRPYLQADYDHVLFSYHGLPERHILKSDVTGKHCLQVADCCNVPNAAAHAHCYRHQCFTTTHMAAARAGIPKDKYSISFQSRLGRDEWLKPYTALYLEELPKKGIKKLVVACPAFVSDCLETLEEMVMQGRDSFINAGGEEFTYIPCLNTHPQWVNTLKTWIESVKGGNREMLLETTNNV